MMPSTLTSVAFFFLVHNCFSGAEILEEPSPVVTFRGTNPTFQCQGTGSIFWFINGTLYDYKNSAFFAERGFLLEVTSVLQDELMERVINTFTVPTSIVSNNNTEFTCAVVGPDNELNVSEDVNLTIIDLPAPRLHPETDPREFKLSWDRIYAPSGFEIHSYDVMVVNENEEVLAKESINATSNATYSYSFMSEQDRSNFPMCSRLVFSVSAINSIGRSQSVNVTLWDNSEDLQMILGKSCSIINSNSVQVHFDKPRVCSFQDVRYTITLSDGRGNVVGSEASTVTRNSLSKQAVTVTTELTLDIISKVYSILIELQVDQQEMKRTRVDCLYIKNPVIPSGEGLQSSESDGLNGKQVAVIVIFAVVTFVVCVINVIAIGYVLYKR